MNGEKFSVELDNLINMAMGSKEHNLPRMIYELGMAKARITRLQLAVEDRIADSAMAKSIVGPNGQLPAKRIGEN